MTAITFESVLAQAESLPLPQRIRLIDALRQNLDQQTLFGNQPRAERKAILDEVCGKYADVQTSVNDFLARKREEVEREEARYLKRHSEEVLP